MDSLERLVTQQSSDTSASAMATLSVAQALLAMKQLQSSVPLPDELIFKDEFLNDSQKQAVRFALESPELALVCTQQSYALTPTHKGNGFLDSWATRSKSMPGTGRYDLTFRV